MKQQRHTSERGQTTLVCAACGTEFTRPNAHIRSETHACSRGCSSKIKKRKGQTMLQATCKHCGKLFERRKGNGGTMEYCSLSCRSFAMTPKKENHPNWKGGISERPHKSKNIIRKKKDQIGKCEECGNTEHLEGHHILKWSEFPEQRNNPDNIQILCRYCHAQKHPDIAFVGKSNRLQIKVPNA